jgi:SAM-dependent methyltransferase
MNKTAGAADFVEWDVKNWSTALDFWSRHTSQDVANCSALEVGSRNGGLSLWLALQGARVLCSDIVHPSDEAIQQHHAHGVTHLIQYATIDAAKIPYEDEFDIVIFKSLLGAVGRVAGKEGQAGALAEIHKALKKGGQLFFAENLVASPLHRFLRRRFVQWGNTWRYVSVADMEAFLSLFSQIQYCTVGFAGAFGRRETHRQLLGTLDQTLLNHIVPESWRYIIIGVATK